MTTTSVTALVATHTQLNYEIIGLTSLGLNGNNVVMIISLFLKTDDITDYILYYKDERSPWMEIAFPVPEDEQYELLNLNKGLQYQLYMRAVSNKGTSDPSEVLSVKTDGEFTLCTTLSLSLSLSLSLVHFDSICQRKP
jgi:hypothetical protein